MSPQKRLVWAVSSSLGLSENSSWDWSVSERAAGLLLAHSFTFTESR